MSLARLEPTVRLAIDWLLERQQSNGPFFYTSDLAAALGDDESNSTVVLWTLAHRGVVQPMNSEPRDRECLAQNVWCIKRAALHRAAAEACDTPLPGSPLPRPREPGERPRFYIMIGGQGPFVAQQVAGDNRLELVHLPGEVCYPDEVVYADAFVVSPDWDAPQRTDRATSEAAQDRSGPPVEARQARPRPGRAGTRDVATLKITRGMRKALKYLAGFGVGVLMHTDAIARAAAWTVDKDNSHPRTTLGKMKRAGLVSGEDRTGEWGITEEGLRAYRDGVLVVTMSVV